MINHLPLDVTNHILKFRDFLVRSWPSLDDLMKNHNWDDDESFTEEWLQANWEFLVEREFLEGTGFLIPIELSKRITFPEIKATHKISCKFPREIDLVDFIRKKRNYENDTLLLTGFRKKLDISYGVYPPFDHVQLRTIDNKKIYIVPISQCQFILDCI